MKIVFMGTPDFAVPCLRTLAESGHDVAAVFTQLRSLPKMRVVIRSLLQLQNVQDRSQRNYMIKVKLLKRSL